ncbi:MAG TPA: type II toxin-antitoxin system VapC family toxin [Acidobacteriaceae bacterium]
MFLLDTNACIEIMNGRPAEVRDRYERNLNTGNEVFVSSISTFELWYGAERSGRPEFNRNRLERFLAGRLEELPFDGDDSARAGELRRVLERLGTPIGPYDTLIAGQALARGLVLVTHNVREFGRVAGLKFEDWQV